MKSDNSLWGFGSNKVGQLGNDTTNNQNGPIKISEGVKDVSVGGWHSLFIKGDSVFACGWNKDGQLGDGTFDYKIRPVKMRLPF